MPIEIGQIEAIFRYPVKSMRGEREGDEQKPFPGDREPGERDSAHDFHAEW